jgi:Tat protein translocase TatB subunit
MFGLGMPEIFLILAIALIVIGPKKLPDLAKTLGRAMGEFKRSAQDFKKSIDLDTTLKDIDSPASDLKNVIKEVNKEKQTIVEPFDDPIMTAGSTENKTDQGKTDQDKTDQKKTMDSDSDTSAKEPDATFTEPESSPPKDTEKKN